MRRTLVLILPILIGLAPGPGRAAEDDRQPVDLPQPVRASMLADMRDHLIALETITQQLADEDYDAAADTAEQHLGLSAMQAHGGAGRARFMPESMRKIGSSMHHAASRFAVTVRDAEVTGNTSAVFGALSDVMRQCVACHEGFRVR
jgi:cytochrome c556